MDFYTNQGCVDTAKVVQLGILFRQCCSFLASLTAKVLVQSYIGSLTIPFPAQSQWSKFRIYSVGFAGALYLACVCPCIKDHHQPVFWWLARNAAEYNRWFTPKMASIPYHIRPQMASVTGQTAQQIRKDSGGHPDFIHVLCIHVLWQSWFETGFAGEPNGHFSWTCNLGLL